MDWIWRDGVALASIDASGTRFLHVDHLGTPRRITNASGALVSTHDYYPFGEQVQTSSDGEVMKFTGHERDFGYASNTDDDLDYMHARYHHPTKRVPQRSRPHHWRKRCNRSRPELRAGQVDENPNHTVGSRRGLAYVLCDGPPRFSVVMRAVDPGHIHPTID
jgi:hypothetical protein